MESIAQSARRGQGKGKGQEGIRLYPLGIHIDSPLKGAPVKRGSGDQVGALRGEITTFTAAARRRMREAMLTLHIDGGELYGLTLTLPWKGERFEAQMDEFRECWHRFSVAFRRRYRFSALIYRIELQTRGAPHVHALFWLGGADKRATGVDACRPLPPCAESAIVESEVGLIWRAAVLDLHRGSYRAFERYGVKVERIADTSIGALFRYLADHASKHKQAQLGYKGKQWGIIHRDNLERRSPRHLPPFESPRHEVIFNRLLRKVMRYRLQARKHKRWKRVPPFGSVLKGSRKVIGDFYLREWVAWQMWLHSRLLARSAACRVERGLP